MLQGEAGALREAAKADVAGSRAGGCDDLGERGVEQGLDVACFRGGLDAGAIAGPAVAGAAEAQVDLEGGVGEGVDVAGGVERGGERREVVHAGAEAVQEDEQGIGAVRREAIGLDEDVVESLAFDFFCVHQRQRSRWVGRHHGSAEKAKRSAVYGRDMRV